MIPYSEMNAEKHAPGISVIARCLQPGRRTRSSMHLGVCLCSIEGNTEGCEHREAIDVHPLATTHPLIVMR
jgi:hypothetical protein